MKLRYKIICSFSVFLFALHALAEEYTTAELIRQKVKVFADKTYQSTDDYGQSRVEVNVSRIDSRLRLSECGAQGENIIVSNNLNAKRSGRVSLRVRCDTPSAWSIYVPIQVNRFQPIMVLSRPLSKGTIIREQDLSFEEFNVSQLNYDYAQTPDEAIGRIAKRSLQIGKPIRRASLESQHMVRKGDAVIIRATNGVIDVKVPGIALMNGREGEQIRVQNKKSQKVIEGRVIQPGMIQVMM